MPGIKFGFAGFEKTPAVMSNESPGRKKPRSKPVSAKIIRLMIATPPCESQSAKVSGS
jgi:hypothetical protein